MRDLQNEKRDLPHSSCSEVEGVGTVVISLQNIAKKIGRHSKFLDNIEILKQFL